MILDLYIIRNYIGPFLFSMSIITFVFIMDFILRYIDLFLNKGVEFLVVLQTFILSLGHMFALIIPMAVLPATLMTFGTLAAENEITAMKASGISLPRMMLPGLVLGLALTVGMIYYNNLVLPETNHKLLNLLIDINKKKPTATVEENKFNNEFEGYTIFVRHKNDKTGEIRDVQIFERDKPGELPRTILAERGRLQYKDRESVLLFQLQNGEIHTLPEGNDPSMYRRTVFKSYTLTISDVDRSLKRSKRDYRGDREMNVSMMRDKIADLHNDIATVEAKMSSMAAKQVRDVMKLLDPAFRDSVLSSSDDDATAGKVAGSASPRASTRGKAADRKQPKKLKTTVTMRALESQKEIKESYFRQINRYEVEIHKKFSISFACLIFVLIGSPIALTLGKSGMNTAIGLSLLVFLVYYICLIGGEKLADRRIVSPVFAMWVPNIFFGACSVLLIRRATREQVIVDWGKLNPLRLLHRS